MAISIAGSVTLTPPGNVHEDIITPSGAYPIFFSMTAASSATRLGSRPKMVRRGVPKFVALANAWSSTRIGRVPSMLGRYEPTPATPAGRSGKEHGRRIGNFIQPPYLSSRRHRSHWLIQIDFLPPVKSEIYGCDPLRSTARCPPYVPTFWARQCSRLWSHARPGRWEYLFFCHQHQSHGGFSDLTHRAGRRGQITVKHRLNRIDHHRCGFGGLNHGQDSFNFDLGNYQQVRGNRVQPFAAQPGSDGWTLRRRHKGPCGPGRQVRLKPAASAWIYRFPDLRRSEPGYPAPRPPPSTPVKLLDPRVQP